MNKEKKNLLVFGYGLALILSFVGVRLAIKHGLSSGNIACLAVAGIMLVITLFNLPALKIIYIYWMKAAHFIGQIVTIVLLSIIFYCVFGVVGIILRILRKDLLDRQWDPQAKTYWQERDLVAFDKERCTKQF